MLRDTALTTATDGASRRHWRLTQWNRNKQLHRGLTPRLPSPRILRPPAASNRTSRSCWRCGVRSERDNKLRQSQPSTHFATKSNCLGVAVRLRPCQVDQHCVKVRGHSNRDPHCISSDAAGLRRWQRLGCTQLARSHARAKSHAISLLAVAIVAQYVNQLADELQAPRLPTQRSYLVTAAVEAMAGGALPAPLECITTILNLPEHSPASIPKIDLPPLIPHARGGVSTTSNGSKRVAGVPAEANKKSAKKSSDKPKKKAAPKAKPLSSVVVTAIVASAAAPSDGVMPMVLEEPSAVKLEPAEEKDASEHENEDEEEEPEPASEPEPSEEEDEYNPNSEEEDDYRPSRRGAQTKRKGKSRQGLSASIFSAGQSKSGRLVKRKASSVDQDEEEDANEGSDAEEEDEPSSSDDDDGERNKKRKGARGTATRVFDSKQRLENTENMHEDRAGRSIESRHSLASRCLLCVCLRFPSRSVVASFL